MIQIELTDKEYQLLMLILKDCQEDRQNMSCNDPNENEKRIFDKKERIQMRLSLYGKDEDENEDDFLFNFDYVLFIINKIRDFKKII